MECNKDEAKRAMDIAERKIKEKDYNEAKQFAIKAQNLYPDLDGLKQLLMAVEVYIGGEKRYGGETDWYGILGVDPLADDEAVRKQYRKLALMLHPDKNKCEGAEGAFKLISEAWSLLSDQSTRFLYNIRRQARECPVRFPRTQREDPVQQPSSNWFKKVREPVVSSARSARTKPASRMDSPAAFVSSIQKDNSTTTFWTQCNECKTQYEYLMVYLNQNLLCPTCSEAFVAKEGVPPQSGENVVNFSPNQHHWSSKNQSTNKKSDGTSSGKGKRGSGESQERAAANFKKPRSTTDDSNMFGSFAAKGSKLSGASSRFCAPSDPTKGNTETLNTIGSHNPQVQGTMLPSDVTVSQMNKSQQAIFERIPEMITKMMEDIEREKKKKSNESKEQGK